ncbi:peptidase S41, partial [Neobacillus drentensis]
MNRRWIALLMTGSLLTGAGGTYAGMQLLDHNIGNKKLELAHSPKDNQIISEENTADLEKVEQAYDLILGRYVE